MHKVFDDFSEVEVEVRVKVPPVIYKYRDWENNFHKKILTENLIWFASPKSLNDPFDIRAPYRFNYDEVNHPLFYYNLRKCAAIAFKDVPTDSREFNAICENQLDRIKNNPQKWFEDQFREIRESNIYDPIGLFSTSIDPANEVMWANYGSNGKGVCVGFDTVELVRSVRVGFGPVIYQDSPLLYSFILGRPVTENDEYQHKHSKWSYEEEFRLITFIKKDSDRLIYIPLDSIKEVVLGIDVTNQTKTEIIQILKSKYNSKIKLLQVKASISSYDFSLNEIKY